MSIRSRDIHAQSLKSCKMGQILHVLALKNFFEGGQAPKFLDWIIKLYMFLTM